MPWSVVFSNYNILFFIPLNLFVGKTSKIFVSSERSHVCLFCKKPQKKVRRHQTSQHKSESQVAKAMAMETAQEPDLAFAKLRLLGEDQYNCDVLDLGEGELIVVRMPKEVQEGIAANFLPCPSCMGFFMASELLRHQQNCPHRSQETPPNGRGYTKKLSFYYQQQYCPTQM